MIVSVVHPHLCKWHFHPALWPGDIPLCVCAAYSLSILHRWTSVLLPCPGYQKQCCNKRWGNNTCIFLSCPAFLSNGDGILLHDVFITLGSSLWKCVNHTLSVFSGNQELGQAKPSPPWSHTLEICTAIYLVLFPLDFDFFFNWNQVTMLIRTVCYIKASQLLGGRMRERIVREFGMDRYTLLLKG